MSDVYHFSVDLVPITPANYERAKGLAVRPDQEDLIASLQKSLADAYVYSDALFRLAFAEDALVGYLLVYPYDSDQGRMVNIARLMIDHRFQGRGFGRQLLETALKWITTFEPAVDIVRISTLPRNIPALSLYESAGFTRQGMENGEVALYLEVNR
jgi:diamine N-acetyltransferase